MQRSFSIEISRLSRALLALLALFLSASSWADEIPATLHPSWPELSAYPANVPVWVSAGQAFGADGKLDPSLFTPEARARLEFLLARPKDPAKGCTVISWIEQEYVNPPDRSTLARAMGSSELAVWGKVVAAAAGFERGDFGQLLMVQPIEVLKPRAAAPARVYFVFVPAGRLQLPAGHQVCKEDPRAVVPAVGEEVLLLPHHAPAGENYLNLEYEGSLIAFAAEGARLPRILGAEAKGAAAAALTKAELVRQIRSLAEGEIQ